jgi:signal transduction histidine kinase
MRRGSVRLRLTVLFGALFLAAGATLLAITYGLVSHATNGIFVSSTNAGGGAGSAAVGAPAALPATDPLQAQATRIAGTAKAAENDALLLYSGIALGIMAVVSMALGWFAAGRALRPLRRITAAAQRISATNLHERLAVGEPDDDLRELADTIDDLFGRLDASFDTQRQFVANASHELRTPLARSRTMLEVALRDPGADAESLRATCRRVLVAGEEQERLLEALLTLARGQRGLDRRAPVDLAAVTRDVLAARGTEIAASGLEMAVTLEPALLAGDRALTERGVANLIDNALRYNVPGGAIWVTVGTGSGQAVLTVANTGPDVPPTEVSRLLVPFERGGTAPSPRARPPAGGDGLGLGLPIVQAIAAAHGAALTIAARPEGGGLAAELAFQSAHPARYPREAPAGAPAASEADLSAAALRLRSVHRIRLAAIGRRHYHHVVSRRTIAPIQ